MFEEYSALIPVKVFGNIESYLVMDKSAYRPGAAMRIYILLRNTGNNPVSVSVKVLDDSNGSVVLDKKVSIAANESRVIDEQYQASSDTGLHTLKLLVDEKPVDETAYYVLDVVDEPSYFTIVWHNHQAPNYDPEGRIHGPWAFIYVWDDILRPYGKGPYHYHSLMMKKHPHYKATYNLSPSLIYQWDKALKEGITLLDGTIYGPDDPRIILIGETLNTYREAVGKRQIDVLTSLYAHTIAGFLIDVLGMSDIVEEELRFGKKITKEIFGDNYEPFGAWTPEMAFSMSLIKIYHENDIRYTILDDQHHFLPAEGDKDTPYEPYIVIDTSTKRYITVFFRDQELSNHLSFRNNFYSDFHAWRNAYEFSLRIVEKTVSNNLKSLVIALDGENWMAFSKNPPLTAYFLDKLIIYLESLDDNRFIKLSSLREIYEEVPAKRVLTYIPTNTWLGTFSKWRGQRSDHENYWVKVYYTYRKLMAYERLVGGKDNYSEQARWALWHALDSDYWWAEFWSPNIIDTWNNKALKILDERLGGIKIVDIRPTKSMNEDKESGIAVTVKNMLDKDVYLSITLNGPCISMNEQVKPAKIKQGDIYTRIIPVKPLCVGEQDVIAAVLSSGLIIDSMTSKIHVLPSIPPNPR